MNCTDYSQIICKIKSDLECMKNIFVLRNQTYEFHESLIEEYVSGISIYFGDTKTVMIQKNKLSYYNRKFKRYDKSELIEQIELKLSYVQIDELIEILNAKCKIY